MFHSHLLPVLPPGGVKALYEVGGVAEEHGVAGGAAHHAQHGQPHVRERLWGEPGGGICQGSTGGGGGIERKKEKIILLSGVSFKEL